ncbi:MAG TPA: SRPBCC domain-containing protein [Pseudonocardiaceae bacterium]
MEYGAIETSIYIDAAPNVVYGVVSSPEHITQWYVDEAAYDVMPGSSGHLSFGDQERWFSVPITVVEAVRGTRFSFRWIAPPAPGLLPVGATLTSDNSLLVTFEFTPRGDGTLLTVTETGMRELGWEAAALEHYYDDHSDGWAGLLKRLESYAESYAGTLAGKRG